MRRGNYQRRRGQVAVIYRSKDIEDRRGNKTRTWDPENPHRVRASEAPARSAKAEVTGQVEINVVTIRVPADLEDVTLQSRVEWDGKVWDVAAPPAQHNGTKHVSHWTIDLRQRPA